MRLDIKPTDRPHMTVWRAFRWDRSRLPYWMSAVAVNGIPVSEIQKHDTFEEALNAALDRVADR